MAHSQLCTVDELRQVAWNEIQRRGMTVKEAARLTPSPRTGKPGIHRANASRALHAEGDEHVRTVIRILEGLGFTVKPKWEVWSERRRSLYLPK